jgi:hypothetical protein
MPRVSLRWLAALALLTVLSAQSASAEPRYRDRSIRERITRFIIHVLDGLGSPPG